MLDMLSPVIETVSSPQTHQIVPAKLAGYLNIPLEQVAELAGTHRNTLRRSPGSPQVQSGLGEVVRILTAAAQLMEGPAAAGRAVLWFKTQPLSGFGGKTARELVRDGHSAAVVEHLAMLADGVTA